MISLCGSSLETVVLVVAVDAFELLKKKKRNKIRWPSLLCFRFGPIFADDIRYVTYNVNFYYYTAYP